MKTIIKIFVIPMLLVGFSNYAQDLSIINGTSLKVLTGTNFYVNGLSLTPTNTDLVLAGPMEISKSTVPVGESIGRVYTLTSPITNFEGDLIFFYEDSELAATGASESDLVLRLKDGVTWSTDLVPTGDSTLNTLKYTFLSPTNFSAVTASKSGITLSTNKFNKLAVEIYPNPTVSAVNIKTELTTEAIIYNNLGQVLLKTNEKNIDVSPFNAGTYLLIVKDTESNNINSYKIIKI
jgi:hypothetical protein